MTNSELNDELDSSEAIASGSPIIVTFLKTGNSYEIDSQGVIKPSTPKDPNVTLKVSEHKNEKFTTNTELEDDYGNKITVPKGFKIIETSPNVVTAGIIIEDSTYTNTIGSQFVWIPVGTGENAIIKNAAKTETVEITLNRYIFEDDTGVRTGIPTPWNRLSEGNGYHPFVATAFIEETIYREGNKDNGINATAKELTTFISSVEAKRGFYIGRYEARTAIQRTNSTSNDKTITDNNLTQITEKQSDYVYNYVTQLQAAKLSREMYSKDNENNNITEFGSDLINSYAWDTATLFLQEFGEENYSIKNSVNTYTDGLAEKGTLTDNPCNIYDMASNCQEWTTETSTTMTNNPCVLRGAYIDYDNGFCTSNRSYTVTDYSQGSISFRPILYIK